MDDLVKAIDDLHYRVPKNYKKVLDIRVRPGSEWQYQGLIPRGSALKIEVRIAPYPPPYPLEY